MRLQKNYGAFLHIVADAEPSGSDHGSWSAASSESDASDQDSTASGGQKPISGQAKLMPSVETSGQRFHADNLNIYTSPHKPQFQKLRQKYAVRGCSTGVQTDLRATTREIGTQAEFDAFASVTGVTKRIQLFESARFTDDGPAVVQFFAEYKLSAKFALENTNVHSGHKTRQEFNLQELKPAEVGELKSIAALHLSRVIDQHKQVPAVHAPGSGFSSSTTLLQSVLLGSQADAVTVALRARTDFTNTSHPLFREFHQADRLIRAQLGSAVSSAAESTAVANLAHAELFVLDKFHCATSKVETANLSLDGVMHACANVKIRDAAMRWAANVRQEIKLLVESQLEEASGCQAGGAQAGTFHPLKHAIPTAPRSGEALLGSGKFSDWVTLAEIVRPLDNDPLKMSIKMRHRVEQYNQEQMEDFLLSLDVPLDLGFSDSSGSFRPSTAHAVIEDKLSANQALATLPSRRKRELNRFVFEVQNLRSLAVVRFSATYVELLSAQKTGILRLADSHISRLEAAERSRHLRTYAKEQERKYAARIQGNVNRILQLAAGSHQVTFASRDAAASQIQTCFRAFLIRRSMHHVKLLAAVLQADAKARQQVRHKVAVPRCSNIRHWLSGVTPWSLGSSSSRGLLDHHLASPESHKSLLPVENLTINRPNTSVKNDLLDLYLEQTTAYSKFSASEMDGGAIWRPPTSTIRFVGQQWKQGFHTLDPQHSSGALTGASVTRGSSGFSAAVSAAAEPTELIKNANQVMHDFTSAALSPPGSPRAVEAQMKEYKWNAVPAQLGGIDTEAHLVASADAFSSQQHPQTSSALPTPTAPKNDQAAVGAISSETGFVGPFELIPFNLAQTVEVLLDSAKYKRIQESWHAWRSHTVDSTIPSAQVKAHTVYDADPNLLRSLPARKTSKIQQQGGDNGTGTATVRFHVPSNAQGVNDLKQPSYDWDAYFEAEHQMFQGHQRSSGAPQSATSAPKLPTGHAQPKPTATPLDRATAFNRKATDTVQRQLPAASARPTRPRSATAAAAQAWQARQPAESDRSSRGGLLNTHSYKVINPATPKQHNAELLKHRSQSPAAKYARFSHRTASKSKRLARPRSAHATMRSRAVVPSTQVGGVGIAVSPTQSYAAPSRGQAWATASMLADTAAAAGTQQSAAQHTRHLGRSIGNHYADVWSSNKGQLTAEGKWTSKQKVKLRGYDRFGMAK